uniref:Uncharacterized protein n=1 Tax=Tanacetum cinerariifolium TaxID=118510 RepID=A0A6L2P4B4_TANCI|nr:hypothetical protein [Tanacetum cinerariifolium]
MEYLHAEGCENLVNLPSNISELQGVLKSTKALYINLSGKEAPEWCSYRNNSGNGRRHLNGVVIETTVEMFLSFVAPIQLHTKICGLIICATHDKEDCNGWYRHEIYNKTKGTIHPLNDTTLLLEAGDTVEFYFKVLGIKSCGMLLIYEDDVVDSGLVLKDVREPTLSLFPLSSEIMTAEIISGGTPKLSC